MLSSVMRKTYGALTNDADGVCASQTPAGAVAMVLNGVLVSSGVATIAHAQIVSIASDGNESGITFTVVGTDADGHVVTEVVTGPNAATAISTYHFKTVTSITTSGAGTGNITVGAIASNGMVGTTLPMNVHQTPFNASLAFNLLTASMTVTVQYTVDDVFTAITNGISNVGDWRSITGIELATADAVSNLAYPVTAVRLIQTTNNGSGTCKFTVIQGN
jgi:hypothetical protein